MMNGINGVQMTGRMTIGLGKNMIGIMSGLVLLMIGLVTGLGLRTIGVLGLRTGPGTLRNGGIPLRPSQPQSSNGAASSGSNVPQDAAKNEPPQNVSAVTVDTSDQSAPRSSKTVRGTKPGLMTNLFVGACLLIGAWSSGVPPMPNQNVPNLKELPENDPIDFDDAWLGFTCRLDWSTSHGYCSTVVLVRIVVLNGSRRTIRRCL